MRSRILVLAGAMTILTAFFAAWWLALLTGPVVYSTSKVCQVTGLQNRHRFF
jgi:hypothetical protein